MMAKVITEGSAIKCAHQGTVTFTASQQKLKVDGQAVLINTDIMSGVISGCQTKPTSAPAPISKPCTKVASLIAGAATKLSVNGTPVLLETANGLTDGIVANVVATWNVQSAEQTKLDTL